MQPILDELYDRYSNYAPDEDIQQEINESHQQLIRSLEKPERKLVLRVIDGKDFLAGARARENFECGFWLAWRLLSQLHTYDSGRSLGETLRADGRFIMRGNDLEEG